MEIPEGIKKSNTGRAYDRRLRYQFKLILKGFRLALLMKNKKFIQFNMANTSEMPDKMEYLYCSDCVINENSCLLPMNSCYCELCAFSKSEELFFIYAFYVNII